MNAHTWLFFAAASPLLMSIVSYVDQFIIRRYFPNKTAEFNTFYYLNVSVSLLTLALLFPVFNVPPTAAIGAMGAGALAWAAALPYIIVLQRYEISSVLSFYEITPFVVAILGWFFLGETLASEALLAILIIVTGCIGMAWNYKHKKIHLTPVLLIVTSALLLGVFYVLLRVHALSFSWAQTTFWVFAGAFCISFLHISFSRKTRKTVTTMLRPQKRQAFYWVIFNQGVEVFSRIALVLALAKAPSAAHVSMLTALYPVFLLGCGLGFYAFFPQHFTKIPFNRVLFYKFIYAGIIILGAFVLVKFNS